MVIYWDNKVLPLNLNFMNKTEFYFLTNLLKTNAFKIWYVMEKGKWAILANGGFEPGSPASELYTLYTTVWPEDADHNGVVLTLSLF